MSDWALLDRLVNELKGKGELESISWEAVLEEAEAQDQRFRDTGKRIVVIRYALNPGETDQSRPQLA